MAEIISKKSVNYKDWEGAIRGFLANMVAYKSTARRAHLLFVEGSTDWEKCQDILNVDRGGYSLRIKESNICFDFTFGAEEVKGFGKPQSKYKKFDSMSVRNHNNEVDESKKKYNYSFVIDAMKEYYTNSNNFRSIDCFGLIDQDFGHDVNKAWPVSMTETHDFETLLVKYYLCDETLVNSIDEETLQQFITEMAKVLEFSFKQGLLESVSFQIERKSGCTEETKKTLITFTHSMFKDASKINSVDNEFDFERYFEKHINLVQEINSSISGMDIKALFDQKVANYIKIPVIQVVQKWLMHESLKSAERSMLDKLFKYSNGHFLCSHAAANSIIRDILQLTDQTEESFKEKLRSIAADKQYAELFKHDSFYSYEQHRITQGNVYKYKD